MSAHPFLLVALLAAPVAAETTIPAAGAANPATRPPAPTLSPGCRAGIAYGDPRFAALGDLDGDAVDDVLETDGGSGSMMSGTSYTLRLSSGERIEGAADFYFGAMLNVAVVPEGLLRRGRERARDAVAARLFGVLCDAPDPLMRAALARARGDTEPVFVDGLVPFVPDNYTVLVRDADVIRALVRDFDVADGAPPKALWVTLAGGTHSRSVHGSLDGPQEIARHGSVRVLRTHHAVVLVDDARSRHAWVWVTLRAFKLRFPSVCPTASVADGHARVPLALTGGSVPGEAPAFLDVDLATGRTSVRRLEDKGVYECRVSDLAPELRSDP